MKDLADYKKFGTSYGMSSFIIHEIFLDPIEFILILLVEET